MSDARSQGSWCQSLDSHQRGAAWCTLVAQWLVQHCLSVSAGNLSRLSYSPLSSIVSCLLLNCLHQATGLLLWCLCHWYFHFYGFLTCMLRSTFSSTSGMEKSRYPLHKTRKGKQPTQKSTCFTEGQRGKEKKKKFWCSVKLCFYGLLPACSLTHRHNTCYVCTGEICRHCFIYQNTYSIRYQTGCMEEARQPWGTIRRQTLLSDECLPSNSTALTTVNTSSLWLNAH